ncbi:MAG: hypothetical protein GEEBNDBF_02656 [bacterium]|nr:hypothetical protein [bacterium]
MGVTPHDLVRKARADLQAAELLAAASLDTMAENVCICCQQAAEKYLKSALRSRRIKPPRTHDLPQLLEILITCDADWSQFREDCLMLSELLTLRYVGSATGEDAEDALHQTRGLAHFAEAWISANS